MRSTNGESGSAISSGEPRPPNLAPGLRRVDALAAPYRLACVEHRRLAPSLALHSREGRHVLVENLDGGGQALAWSADGQRVLVDGPGVRAFDAATGVGTALRFTEDVGEYLSLWRLSCSPDDTQVFFMRIALPLLNSALAMTELCVSRSDGADLRVLARSSAREAVAIGDVHWPSRVAVALVSPRRLPYTLWRIGIDDGTRTQIAQVLGTPGDSALSPDGARLVLDHYSAEGDRLSLVRVTDGLAEPLLASGRHPAWAPDGRSIAFHDDDDRALCRMDLATRAVERLVWFDPPPNCAPRYYSYVRQPVFSPDGRLVFFGLMASERNAPLEVWSGIVDLARGEVWLDATYRGPGAFAPA